MRTIHAQDAAIPALGFGTFQLEGAVARDQVAGALDAGYRHVDTARVYGNEREVGEGIARSRVPRDQVFLTSKLWPDDFRPEDVARATRASLADLGTDHLDLLLLHWPNPEVPVAETLGALERAREEGLIRHYGVSNFTVPLFEEAADAAPRALVTNQVEFHPLPVSRSGDSQCLRESSRPLIKARSRRRIGNSSSGRNAEQGPRRPRPAGDRQWPPDRVVIRRRTLDSTPHGPALRDALSGGHCRSQTLRITRTGH
ncbi:MAG: aldo/keto reductase [Pseudomonadales bacterium]|jgi:aryl-alcohol dehydrogenase-like predicted oxidoreductase|nr:aldo/keto reductase [Pseudomonadales bacterium]